MVGMKEGKPILVLANEDDPQLARLVGVEHILGGEARTFAPSADSATAILNWSGSRELLRSVFAMCPNVTWVHSRSAGLDSMLFPELTDSDVILTNSKGVFSAALGEFALAAILYFAKDFRRMLRNQSAGIWEPFDVQAISDKTVGIIGYGDIGQAVAKRLSATGMRVLALKRHLPQETDPLIERFYTSDTLHQLLACCDYVVVTAPLTTKTRHMIGEAEFGAMKSSAVIVNVGRGAVIDEEALVRALTNGRIRGAGLDVFEHEPLPHGHPLYKLENVLLSPHCADNTPDWKDRAMTFFLEQYRRFERGEPLTNVVNKQLGY
jgi:phosphoglycerate dehydrogenase-like enzyme